MPRLIPAIALMLICIAATARETTSRGTLRPEAQMQEAVAKNDCVFDTITSPEAIRALIGISGYDKPLNSRHETLHLTNRSDSLTVSAVTLTITYTDRQGRTLHSRTVSPRTYVEPGQTRIVSFQSWDKQFSYYYSGSRKPRTSGVTPYDVSITPTAVVIYNTH